MAPGKFDDHTHEQLQKMIASGTPDKISAHAQTLESAAQIIAQASAYVDSVVSRLEWKGEAAQAYRSWATQFAKEGNKLSEYAQSVGTALSTAGQALNETKSGMPNAGSESAWREETMASPGAEVSREKARQEAIQRMERLDSYYAVASEQIRDTKEPTFKATNGGIQLPDSTPIPKAPGSVGTESPVAASRTSSLPPTTDVTAANSPLETGNQQAALPQQAPSTQPPALQNEREIGTSLDSVGTTSDSRNAAASTAPPQNASSSTSPPQHTGVPGVPAGTPPIVGSPRAPEYGLGRPSTGVPSASSPGAGPGGSGRGLVGGQPPASPGIHGGKARYLPSSPSQARMPRGAVIDSNATQQPGRPLPPAGYAGSAVPAAGTSQQASRRLVRASDGTSSASSSSGRREFTPGGTGLVQRGVGTGARTGEQNRGSRRFDGSRPNYLREDEETWQVKRQRVVPPVID